MILWRNTPPARIKYFILGIRVNQNGTIDHRTTLRGLEQELCQDYSYYQELLGNSAPYQKIINHLEIFGVIMVEIRRALSFGDVSRWQSRIFLFQNVVQGLTKSMYTILIQARWENYYLGGGNATQISGNYIPRRVRLKC
jgi:hypothetical protein